MFDLFNRKRINDLEIANANLNRRLRDWEDLWKRLEPIFAQGKVTNLAVARIIARIDPTYAQDELDPVRKAASDKLADQVIRKMIGDHNMSNRTGLQI